MRVLLIEDDPATSQSIEMMLRNAGLNVYATDLGEEGIDLRFQRREEWLELALHGVDFLGGNLRCFPVEATCVVGACGLAIAAADTPVVVHDDNTVFFFPGGLNRAHLDAWSVVTLLALYRHIKMPLLGNLFWIIVGVGM